MISSFFQSKSATVREETADADPPTFSVAADDCTFSDFCLLSCRDVFSFLQRLPDKNSQCDLMPVSLLKAVSDLLLPFLTELVNRSLYSGVFPES